MIRKTFIEQILIEAYGGLPSDDAEINIEMINNAWMNTAIALAAKTCYTQAIQIDGIGYVNNSFYTTFSGITITTDDTENLGYKLTLPEVPVGIGRNEGVATLKFKDENGFISQTGIPLSINQQGYADNMRTISNKILYWPEGNLIRMKSSLPLWSYTAVIKMISGGVESDLNSELNVPGDFHPVMQQYIREQLLTTKSQPKDLTSDGVDTP